jgi:tRNA A37 methylthiotransferase MiaB
MKRGSSSKKIKEILSLMKQKDSFVRTSVIVGHPGEKEEYFEELKDFLEEFEFDRVNVFAYSDEEGTKSFERNDKIDEKTIEKRTMEIEKIVKKTTKKSLEKMKGKTIEAFLDGKTPDGLFYSARPKLWAPEVDGDVLINESEIENLKTGKIYKVKINQIAGEETIGKIVE